MVPSDRAIVVERFRDEIGDWRLCVLSPFGGRVHAAWGLALSARIRDELGLESDAIWSDDGIIVHLPDAEEPPGADLVMLEPDEVEDAVVAELGASALFGARFRENAARALLIPRARPGKRTPLWQQRLKAQSLLEVAKKYGEFPIVLETYRECLRDVLDVPGLVELLTALHRREISLVEVETADRLAVRLLAAVRLRRDVHVRGRHAERRAPRGGAVARPRAAARAARAGGAARPDRPGRAGAGRGATSSSSRTCAGRPAATGCTTCCARVGDLTVGGGAGCGWSTGSTRDAMLEELRGERRAVAVRLAGEERWIDAADAGLYRDALGAAPPGGLPAAFLEDVPDALSRLVRRYAATHGPFTADDLRARYGVDCAAVLGELERDGELVRGELRPGGTEREWCDPEVLRRLRRASLAVLRKEVEPVDQRALARFLPAWQGVDRHPPTGAGVDRLREVLVPLQGLALPGRGVGARRPAAAGRRLLAGVDRPAVRERRARVDRRRRARAALRPGGAVLPRGPAAARARPPTRGRGRAGLAGARGGAGAAAPPAPASSPTCSSTSTSRPRSCRRRCGIWPGRARRPTTRSRRCGRRG